MLIIFQLFKYATIHNNIKLSAKYFLPWRPRQTRGPHLCLPRCKGADVQGRERQPRLATEDPALVGASLSLPRPTSLPSWHVGLC